MLASIGRFSRAFGTARTRGVASSAAGIAASAAAAAISVLKPVGAGYAITLALAIAFQRKLQYFPSSEHPQLSSLPVMYAAIEEHAIESSDGNRCYLWHWPAPKEGEDPLPPDFLGPEGSRAVHPVMTKLRAAHPSLRHVDVLLFHGNAGSREHRRYWMHLLREGLGCSVTVLDYRGYGGSAGSPTERGLIRDGAAAYEWLRERQRRPVRGTARLANDDRPARATRRPVLWGESIGTGVAVALLAGDGPSTLLGADKPVDGRGEGEASGGKDSDRAAPLLVLESGFTSCVDIGAAAYPWIPVRLGMLDRFESEARAKRLAAAGEAGVPLLSLHGEEDEIAPIALGRALFDAMPSPRKRWVRFAKTGHNDVPYRDAGRYLNEVARFLVKEVDEP